MDNGLSSSRVQCNTDKHTVRGPSHNNIFGVDLLQFVFFVTTA